MSEEGTWPEVPLIFNDLPLEGDEEAHFQFKAYAGTFARLIASKHTRTPLMQLIQGRLDETRPQRRKEGERLSFLSWEESAAQVFSQHFRTCKTVWFNAWKYGREDALLAALIRTIVRTMQADGWLDKVKAEIADPERPDRNLFTAALDFASQLLSGGLMQFDLTKHQAEAPVRAQMPFFEQFSEELDRLLAWYVNGLSNLRGEIDDQRGVLVVFIDDLDRCLPDKMVQVLEAVKLFLDKRGCVFVLGADRRVVREAVAAHYRRQQADIAARSEYRDYLEKIIQVRFDLPPLRQRDMETYVETLGKGERPLDPTLLTSLSIIVSAREMNPRHIKTFINFIELGWAMLQRAEPETAKELDKTQFIEWQALRVVAPDFCRELQEREPKTQALALLQDTRAYGLAQAEEDEQASADLVEKRPRLRKFAEDEALLRVLRAGQFAFDVRTLEACMFLSAPLVVELPEEEPPPLRVERGEEELTIARFESLGTEDAKRGLMAMIADEAVDLQHSIAAAEALGRLGDPRLGEMVEIPAGEFIFGEGEAQKTIHLDAFQISEYPLTNAEYGEFVRETGHRAPGYWDGNEPPRDKLNHPVVYVSWDDAQAYAEWAGKQLPTEEQWEKAARGGDGREYPWGNGFDNSRCNTEESGIGGTTPVGVYPGGVSPYTVQDMAGNVWEWTAGKHEDVSGSRVLRGGSWSDNRDYARCAFRNWYNPGNDWSNFGFRVVVSPISPPSGL